MLKHYENRHEYDKDKLKRFGLSPLAIAQQLDEINLQEDLREIRKIDLATAVKDAQSAKRSYLGKRPENPRPLALTKFEPIMTRSKANEVASAKERWRTPPDELGGAGNARTSGVNQCQPPARGGR